MQRKNDSGAGDPRTTEEIVFELVETRRMIDSMNGWHGKQGTPVDGRRKPDPRRLISGAERGSIPRPAILWTTYQ